jgi:hypothetical protein
VVCDEVGVVRAPASAPDRRLFGAASAYPADGMLAARESELLLSQRARRAAAWDVVARVLAPIPLAETTGVPGATVPRFRSWYDREDVARIFEHAYEALGPAGRAARERPSDALLDEAMLANVHTLDGLPAWTPDVWSAHLAAIDEPAEVAALGGLRRIAISPDAARHVARSYPEILGCLERGSPPAFADGPPAPQELLRERVAIAPCGAHLAGPFWIASGGTIEAHVEGAAPPATVHVLAGASRASAIEACAADAEAGCSASGPGAFFVEILAGGLAAHGTLDVSHAAPDVPFAGCLDGVFPIGAATVAAQWQRVELGPLPTYDTSGAALAAHLAGDATWGPGGATADPGPEQIYTQRVPAGGTFRLAGMHIRTREVGHWMNITLWWSPSPDETFGEDRPASVRALGGPWSHYAMCVAIDDVERDPDPSGGFAEDAPSLAAALAAVHGEPASWCSNPYIDAAPGLVRSNCVGCHQHAMSGVRPGEIVMDEVHYPEAGRLFVRNNFPGDAFWGLDAGDDLAVVIADTVSHWDTAAAP